MSNALDKKKQLFISYSSKNIDKVNQIKKALQDHPLFEPLIVADRRRANKALTELVKKGIESSYCIIPILSPESIQTQWINQEIGYAEGVKVPIIPIVENSIMEDLNGFVHSQNQCPYSYTFRAAPFKSSENKDFMSRFRLLISDLEEEIKNHSEKELQMRRTIFYRKPLGTRCNTGEECPEGGIWETEFEPKQVMVIPKGVKMPPLRGLAVRWKLIEYRDDFNIIPNG